MAAIAGGWSPVSPRASRIELAARAAEGSIRACHQLVWIIQNPGKTLRRSWYLEAMLEHLQALITGEIKRLIVNVPPGSGKTVAGSYTLPCYAWLQEPGSFLSAESRILAGSYSMPFSKRLNARRLKMMLDPRWQRLMRPKWEIEGSAASSEYFENSLKGWMGAISSDGGVATGEHSDLMLIDDPQDPKRAASHAMRDQVELWIRETLTSRFRDHADPCIALIMQRLHGRDATAVFQSVFPDFTVLEIDALAPKAIATGVALPPRARDPRTAEGQSFDPKRFPKRVLDARRRSMVGFGWQFRQHSEDEDGRFFKAGWFRLYPSLPADAYTRGTWAAAMDTTYGKSARSDFVAIAVWVALDGIAYLVDERRARMDFHEALAHLRDMARKYSICETWLIEGGTMANGRSIITSAKEPDASGYSVFGVREVTYARGDDKETRATSVAPIVKMGRVAVPSATQAPWVDEWVKEHVGFPGLTHDDRVDTTLMALDHLRSVLFAELPDESSEDWEVAEAPVVPGMPTDF